MGTGDCAPEAGGVLVAAVIIPIVRYDEPKLVLVRRAAHLRRNPGQIAFPGGLVDPADRDRCAAALRELDEELGIARHRTTIVGRLDDVVTLALSVTVAPYVGVIEPPVAYLLDANETESVHEIPLAAIYAAGALHRGLEIVEREGVRHEVPSWLFDFEALHVWGATARMLRALVIRYRTPAEIFDYLRAP